VSIDGRAQLYPAQISGGEQQRVAIARALMTAPQLLLADEPTGNLDPDRAIEIMRIFRAINRRGTTVLVATHDPDLIAAMRRRTLILEAGLLRTLTAARKVS
jgi:cell division transport system ATP-binding protein